jgi:hypothetical protein
MYIVTAFINVTHPVGITFMQRQKVKIMSDFLFGVCFSGSYEKNETQIHIIKLK